MGDNLYKDQNAWHIDGVINEEDRKRIESMRFRRAGNGLYFSAFSTKEEAYLLLKTVARRYKYSSLHDNTLADLCEEYQSKGIMLYPTQLGKWMKNVFGVNVRYTGYGKPLEKVTTTVSLDRDLKYNYLNDLKDDSIETMNISRFVNEVLRVFVGMQHDSAIVFISDEIRNQPVPVMFYFHKEELQALFFGKVQGQTRKIIQLLSDVGEDEGLEGIKQRAKRLGYYSL